MIWFNQPYTKIIFVGIQLSSKKKNCVVNWSVKKKYLENNDINFNIFYICNNSNIIHKYLVC